jgi:hypothetical protein
VNSALDHRQNEHGKQNASTKDDILVVEHRILLSGNGNGHAAQTAVECNEGNERQQHNDTGNGISSETASEGILERSH